MFARSVGKRSSQISLLLAAILVLSGQSLGDSGSTTSASIGPWGEQGDVPFVGDFDRDGYVDDLAVFRADPAYLRNCLLFFDFDHNGNTDTSMQLDVSRMGSVGRGLGDKIDKIVAGDFDHDGFVNDYGIFTTTGTWYFGTLFETGEGMRDSRLSPTMNWGLNGDLPVAGDFDLDGYMDDVAVYRYSDKTWYFNTNLDDTTDRTLKFYPVNVQQLRLSPPQNFGDDARTVASHAGSILNALPGGSEPDDDHPVYLPIAGDFNGDHEVSDIGIFKAGADQKWYFDYEKNGNTDRTTGPWGLKGDIAITGDFDEDGYIDDIGVFRPSTGEWFFQYQDVHWSAPGMTGGTRLPTGILDP